MLRNVRKITPLLRSLLLGVAAVSTVSVSSAVMMGCEDENQPEYYTKRLDDPALRPQAVKRLVQFFEDAMTRADKDRSQPHVKELLDKIIPPLTKTYLEGDTIDDRTKGDIIKLLADSRDERAKPAWIKALKDYKPNVNEPDVRACAKVIAETGIKDPEAMDAIIEVFVKFEAGSPKGALIYVDLKKSLVEIASPSWKPQLLERLNRPMEKLEQNDRTNEDKVTAYRNEQFWQVTAAEVLGEIKATDAIKPLFKTVIDPNKADVAATAIMAMVKMGKDSMNTLVDALLGKDAELTEFAKVKIKDQKEAAITPVRSAALVIGTIGRADGVEPMMLALGKTDKADYITQAILARELSKCPGTPESLKAYIKVFNDMPVSAVIPPGHTAVAVLAESIAQFYDPSVIDVLINRVDSFKGEKEDKDLLRDSVLPTMIKLMRKDQIALVEGAIGKWAPGKDDAKLEKEALEKAKAVLNACGDKPECYLAKLEEAAVQEKKEQFQGIKSAYMLGILGSDKTRLEIVKRFPNIKNAAIKYTAGQALDFLAPKGDQASADEINKQLQVNIEKGDQNLISGDAPLRQIRIRLVARL
jgi:HEAT repeat protein